MALLDALLKGLVSRALPQPLSDTSEARTRLTRYGELAVLPAIQKPHPLADEGAYFVATNPTPGSAITYAITTAFSDTVGAYFAIKNNDSASNTSYKRVYLDYIKLLVNTVPASATAVHYAIKVDNVSRYTSGGSIITPVSTNMDIANTGTVAQMWAGALTLTAAGSSARIVARGTLRGVIPTINDSYVINCGGMDGGGSLASAAASGRAVDSCPPIIIGPQQFALVHLWFPSNAATAGQFEFEVGWWER
jgi:hypothetical protein